MSEVYDEKTGKPQPEVLKKHFVQEGLLEEEVAIRIISEGEREGKAKQERESRGWVAVGDGEGKSVWKRDGDREYEEDSEGKMKGRVRDEWCCLCQPVSDFSV